VITFAQGVAGTILLNSLLPRLAGPATITGPGADILTLNGNGKGVVLGLGLNTNVPVGPITVSGLTIPGGRPSTFIPPNTAASDGGGIVKGNNFGSLVLDRVVITDNQSSDFGGGIVTGFLASSLTIRDSTISNNSAVMGGGLAIHNNTSIENSIITGNTATGDRSLGGGGGIANLGGLVSLRRSTVSNNSSPSSQCCGGGILNSGRVDISDSDISGNTSNSPGGGIATWGDFFGGLTIANSTVRNNVSSSIGGGGLLNAGSAALTNVTFSGNRAGSPGSGGNVLNCSALCLPSLLSSPRDLTLTNVTLVGGVASTGGNIFAEAGGTMRLQNTVLDSGAPSNCAGTLVSQGNNLSSDGSCALTGPADQNSTATGLGPLAPNGGPTLTHMPQPRSAAIDHAAQAACPINDQRGVTRPIDGDGDGVAICDIGAVEAAFVPITAASPTPTSTATAVVAPTAAVPRHVAPQIFQNLGGVAIVQARPPATPRPQNAGATSLQQGPVAILPPRTGDAGLRWSQPSRPRTAP